MVNIFKKINNSWYIIIAIIALILILFTVWLFTPGSVERYISKNCPKYEIRGGFADQTEFIDCKNYIGIERYSDESFYTVFIDTPVDREAPSNNVLYTTKDKFYFSGNDLYVTENVDLDTIAYFRNGHSYTTTLKVKDKSEIITFSSKEDVPIFRKIDSLTGNFTLYKTLEEIPEGERVIFKKLMQKQ